jgi:hypothetical protein
LKNSVRSENIYQKRIALSNTIIRDYFGLVNFFVEIEEETLLAPLLFMNLFQIHG